MHPHRVNLAQLQSVVERVEVLEHRAHSAMNDTSASASAAPLGASTAAKASGYTKVTSVCSRSARPLSVVTAHGGRFSRAMSSPSLIFGADMLSFVRPTKVTTHATHEQRPALAKPIRCTHKASSTVVTAMVNFPLASAGRKAEWFVAPPTVSSPVYEPPGPCHARIFEISGPKPTASLRVQVRRHPPSTPPSTLFSISRCQVGVTSRDRALDRRLGTHSPKSWGIDQHRGLHPPHSTPTPSQHTDPLTAHRPPHSTLTPSPHPPLRQPTHAGLHAPPNSSLPGSLQYRYCLARTRVALPVLAPSTHADIRVHTPCWRRLPHY